MSALVTQQLYRDVIGRFASGVTVVTSGVEGRRYGTTASAVSSLSLEPPMLLICLNRTSETGQAIHRAGAFAVNILGDDQADIAGRFARSGGDKFGSLPVLDGATGAPLIADSLAHLECRVAETVTGGTHTIFLGEVLAAAGRDGTPLTYFRGGFGRFETAVQDAVHQQLRELVLNRSLPLDRPLDLDELAQTLARDRAHVSYALTKLSTEGLVEREPDGGHTIRPLTAERSDEIFDARGAIEIAVADMVVGTIDAGQHAALRALAEAALEIAEQPVPDVPAFTAATHRFHEAFVALSGNGVLAGMYRGLGIHAIGSRAMRHAAWAVHKEFALLLVRLADASAAGDLAAAKDAIHTHSRLAKALARDVIGAAGGEL